MRTLLGVIRVVVAILVVGVLIGPVICVAASVTPYIVSGGSMSPTFQIGDIVYVKSKPTYRVGDVVHIRKGEGYVHRIIAALDDGSFQTCGDANCPDPVNRLAGVPDLDPVPMSDLGGKVMFRVGSPWVKAIRLGSTWSGRIVGAIICIVVLWPWGEGRTRRKIRSKTSQGSRVTRQAPRVQDTRV